MWMDTLWWHVLYVFTVTALPTRSTGFLYVSPEQHNFNQKIEASTGRDKHACRPRLPWIPVCPRVTYFHNFLGLLRACRALAALLRKDV